LRRMVVKDFDLLTYDQLPHQRVLNIRLREVDFGIQIFPCPARQIVNYKHFVTSINISISNVRTNKPGATSDQYTHDNPSFLLRVMDFVGKVRDRLPEPVFQ